ncbi:MAG: glutamine cyclotransferase [Chitinophagaceae bacterium]|nr:glutamine cyclotransferase [Chitinophagaceae bacterium]
MACNNSNNNDDNSGNGEVSNAPASMSYSVVNIYPHDTSFFTEGLELHDNYLYESTGSPDSNKEGQTRVTKINLKDGKALQQIRISDPLIFGEGITILNNKIYELTWMNKKVFVYDLATFKKIQEFDWITEGWGMTNNGKSLIISTGTSNIYYVNPDSFKVEKIVSVTDNNGPVGNINELEYVNGYIYSNVWQTDYILKINAETGRVEARSDLKDILTKNNVSFDPERKEVLNGIAYNPATKTFFVTGKYWPAILEVKFN